MVTAADEAWMTRALALAERGRGRTAPNPLVGAVVVSPDGVVRGQGAHLEAGGPHAEVAALEAAGPRARGATLYVTLEPCCHHGRTGPCADRIVAAGIARVVAAIEDPNPRVAGGGLARLRAHGVAVAVEVAAGAARRQNAPFLTWITRGRPYVTAKVAISGDGFAGVAGERVKLTGAAADRWFHRQRAEVDAMAVGSATVRADDPQLTPRGAWRARPLTRVIVDWQATVLPTARVFSTLAAGPVIMVVAAGVADAARDRLAALEARGVLVERLPAHDLGAVLRMLAARDVLWLLVEGGPVLQRAFLDANLVDHMQWIVTPRALGRGLVPAGLEERGPVLDHPPRATRLGDDVLLEFDVHGAD